MTVSYGRRLGRRPMEQASKSSHQHVINDAEVQKFLGRCALPRSASDVALNDHVLLDYEPAAVNPIRHIVAQVRDDTSMLETLRWFLFEEYLDAADEYNLASCPECEKANVTVHRAEVTKEGRFPCDKCKASLYLTDVFRLHEAVDDTVGAGGILGYVTTLLEQFVMVHFLRLILEQRPALLKRSEERRVGKECRS